MALKTPRLENVNYTQVPNQILDSVSEFTEAELKVLLVIVRETIGWGARKVALTTSALAGIAGIHRSTASDAAQSLEDKGFIVRSRQSANTPTEYELFLPIRPVVGNSVHGNSGTHDVGISVHGRVPCKEVVSSVVKETVSKENNHLNSLSGFNEITESAEPAETYPDPDNSETREYVAVSEDGEAVERKPRSQWPNRKKVTGPKRSKHGPPSDDDQSDSAKAYRSRTGKPSTSAIVPNATAPLKTASAPQPPTGPTWQDIAADWERITGKGHGCDAEHCRSWIPDVEKAGRDATFSADRLEIFARCRRMFDCGKGAWITFRWLFKVKDGASVGWWRIRSREFEWQETADAPRPTYGQVDTGSVTAAAHALLRAQVAKAKELENAANA